MTKQSLIEENKALKQDLLIMRNRLAKLERMLFGSKSERHLGSADGQLTLDFGELEQAESKEKVKEEKEQITYTRKKKKHPGRNALPADLPRTQMIIEPEEDTTGMVLIGEEITEVLCKQPSTFFILEYVRKKYAYPNGEGVVIGKLPSRAIEKSIAHESLLADILVSKYADHLPLYRQIERMKRVGVDISKSTMSDWVNACCRLLEPLYRALRNEVLSSDYIQADESPIPVQDKNKSGKTHQGYQWVYCTGDEDLVLFDYQKGRGREGPAKILKHFEGYLQTDGYGVYDKFGKKEKVTLIGCMAHARRYFEQALQSDPDRAAYVLDRIQELYKVERQVDEYRSDWQRVLQMRQRISVPILEALKGYLEQQKRDSLPKSPFGKAIHYMLIRWKKLTHYTTHGGLKIDNNRVENMIRPLALGRKNYLFAGSHHAAKNAAIIYSLVGSCKLNGLNPYQYLFTILSELPTYPINKVSDLLPCFVKLQEQNIVDK